MTAQAERALVQTGPQSLTPVETDWGGIERVFRKMVGRNGDDNQVAAAMIVCKHLGFNPILNHIFLIEGQVYVSHKGLLNLAHRSGVFDGIEVLEEGETPIHWTAKVAVHRKDMSRPFVYSGRYAKGGRNKQYGQEMAVTRAESMALRRAFDVGIPIYEEINWQEQDERRGATEARATVTVREVPPAQVAAPVETGGLSHNEFADLLAALHQMDADGQALKAINEFADSQWDTLTVAQQEGLSTHLDRITEGRKARRAQQRQAQAQAAPIVAEVLEAVPARTVQVEEFGWTEFWAWARPRGIDSRAALDAALGRDSKGLGPVDLYAELQPQLAHVEPEADPFDGGQPAAYAG